MLILTIRTDKPDAEIGLYDNQQQLAYKTWQAHRQLAETIHAVLQEVINQADKTLAELEGILLYQGPGSFTGLRIGASVANALAGSLKIPIVGATENDWIITGSKRLLNNQTDKVVIPLYGSLPNITLPKK